MGQLTQSSGMASMTGSEFARAFDRVIARERVKLVGGKAVEPPG
jgi:hypothetical protein